MNKYEIHSKANVIKFVTEILKKILHEINISHLLRKFSPKGFQFNGIRYYPPLKLKV